MWYLYPKTRFNQRSCWSLSRFSWWATSIPSTQVKLQSLWYVLFKSAKILRIFYAWNAMHTSVASILWPLILGYYSPRHRRSHLCIRSDALHHVDQSITTGRHRSTVAVHPRAATGEVNPPRRPNPKPGMLDLILTLRSRSNGLHVFLKPESVPATDMPTRGSPVSSPVSYRFKLNLKFRFCPNLA
jgi:hypothetical protein